ncbi:glycosyl transferase, partial [Pseudomonas fluorescens]
TGLLDQLSPFYDIRVDEWKGHDAHDPAASQAALDWAELIWCEWLLGNAVWYAQRRRSDQILIARMHRFELGRDFGERMAIENVNAVVAVSTLFFERLLERFPSIPRPKARLLPNYIDTKAYTCDFNPERRFTLGVIGILP